MTAALRALRVLCTALGAAVLLMWLAGAFDMADFTLTFRLK